MFHLGYTNVCGVRGGEYIISFRINVALESNREVIGYRRTNMPMMGLYCYVCVVCNVCVFEGGGRDIEELASQRLTARFLNLLSTIKSTRVD